MVQIFEIPIPVSANRMWRTTKRGQHHPSKKYTSFINALGWYLQLQGIQKQPSPVRFSLVVVGGKGWRINADIDNRIKPTLDALVKNRILEDDSTQHVKQKEVVYIERASRAATCRIFVRLEEPQPTWWDTFEPPTETPLQAAAGGNR